LFEHCYPSEVRSRAAKSRTLEKSIIKINTGSDVTGVAEILPTVLQLRLIFTPNDGMTRLAEVIEE